MECGLSNNRQTSSSVRMERWKLLKRLAVVAIWLVPWLACLGVLAGFIPRGPILSQPYALTVALTLLSCSIVFTLWLVDKMEVSNRNSAAMIGLQELRLLRYYGVQSTVTALIGLALTALLLGWASAKYLMGGACTVLGMLSWLTGYVREQQLTVFQVTTGESDASGERGALLRHYKAYYVDRQNIMLSAYVASAFGSILGYGLLGLSRYLSILDLAGFLFLVISSGFWDFRIGQRVKMAMQTTE